VIIVFGLALLVLAAAVVVLFAMLAELASRIPADSRTPVVQPVDGVALGHAPDGWPPGLPAAEQCVLLVLSPTCSSCADIARQLSEGAAHLDQARLGLVIPAMARGARLGGEEFVAQHRLERFRHHLDEGGDWVATQFGVRLSPVALVFRAGRLTAAYSFNDIAALWTRVTEDWQEQQEEATL
jgi:hypothetical protein